MLNFFTALPVRGRTRRTLKRTCAGCQYCGCLGRGWAPLKEKGRYAIGKGATNSLAERAALADGNLVTLLDTESGRDVGGDVLVPLLVTRVLLDEVEVLPADDDRAVHLGRNDGAGEDTAADRDEAGEGALLVCRDGVLASHPVISKRPRRSQPRSLHSSA